MKLSEEIKHCLDGDGCGKCRYGEPETKLTCRGLLQAAYEEIKRNEKDRKVMGKLKYKECENCEEWAGMTGITHCMNVCGNRLMR